MGQAAGRPRRRRWLAVRARILGSAEPRTRGPTHDEISDHRNDGGVASCVRRSGARRRFQRSHKNDASRLDRSVDHDPAHGRGVEECRAQRRIRPGGLPRPIRRPQDRRLGRRHGDLGDDRQGRDGRGDRHRQGGEPRRDRHEGHRGVVVPGIHEGEVPGPARLGGAEEMRRAILNSRDGARRAATSAAR